MSVSRVQGELGPAVFQSRARDCKRVVVGMSGLP